MTDVSLMNSYIFHGTELTEPYLLNIKHNRVEIIDPLSGKTIHTIHSIGGKKIVAYTLCSDDFFIGGTAMVIGCVDGSVQFWTLGLLDMMKKKESQHP
jgi:hypothetical protein